MKNISRRQFVGRMGAGAAAIGLQGLIPARSFANPLGMDVGIQLYSIKPELEKDFEGTVKAVAAIGYKQVETNLSLNNRKAKEIREALQAVGLGWKSAHTSVAELRPDVDRIIEQAHDAGVQYLICSVPWVKDPSRIKPVAESDPLYKTYGKFASFIAVLTNLTLDDWKWNAEFLNEAGEKTKKAGIQIGYHNHPFEFKKLGDTTGYDELLRLTDPDLVKFQLDCGWMVFAGQDPVTYLEKYPKRYRLLHIKDLKSPGGGEGLAIHTTEVGKGIVDWKRIFAAAKKTEVVGYYVEQEPPYERPPLESAKISYDYLHALSV